LWNGAYCDTLSYVNHDMFFSVRIMYVLSTAGAQDFPPVFVNPDSDSGDWIDVYENEMSGVYIYTMSVDDPDFLDIHTYRYKFVS